MAEKTDVPKPKPVACTPQNTNLHKLAKAGKKPDFGQGKSSATRW